jgi:putative endopeptidase
LDSTGLEQKALQSLKADIEEIYRVKNKTDLARLMGEMNKGIAIAPLKFGVSPDYNDPTKLNLYLYTSRDYFSFYEVSFYKDPARAGLRKQHQEHIATMLAKVGLPHTANSAMIVQNLESKILNALETPPVNFTVPATLYVSAKEMAKKYPGFDWQSFLDGAGIAANQDISIADEILLKKLLKVIANEPLQSWQDMLVYQLIKKMSPDLPVHFGEADFNFYQKSFGYASQMPSRTKTCIVEMSNKMPMQIGKLFVDNYIDTSTKPRIKAMTQAFIEVYKKRIASLEWMSQKGKEATIRKLNKTKLMIGYPDKWPAAPAIEFTTDNAYENEKLLWNYKWKDGLAKLGKPVEIDSSWLHDIGPTFAGATAAAPLNAIIVGIGICVPPFFDPAADDAVNYGAIGVVIAHEISHLFDVVGRQFDEDGKVQQTWDATDIAKYNTMAEKLAAQMSTYEVAKGVFVNGQLTLAESIADLGGLQIAYDVFRNFKQNKAAKILDGFTDDQRFFLAFSQNWKQKIRPEVLINLAKTETHPPSEVRSFFVRNIDSWYPAFNVQPENKLYLAPEKRIKIW